MRDQLERYKALTESDPSSAMNLTQMRSAITRAQLDAGEPLDTSDLADAAAAATATGMVGGIQPGPAKPSAPTSPHTKLQPNTRPDSFYRSNTDTDVFTQNQFDMQHSLSGDINAKGKGSGYHAEFAANGEARIKPGATVNRNADGTYEAPVQIWNPDKLIAGGGKGAWVDKARNSTFFPETWSEARVLYEVGAAYKVKEPHPSGLGYLGRTPSGLEIKFTWDQQNQRTTFYPTGKK
jgi:hypothetical protein